MDSANHSSDKLQSVRRRNKTLIIIFFSLIIVLALIIGGIIISLVQKINSPSPYPSQAILEFCTVSYSESSGINTLSAAIETGSNTNPNGVLLLSLKTSLNKLSGIISAASDETRPEPAFASCLSSLSRATDRLSSILDVLRVDPDLESRNSDQRREMSEWISGAAEDLAVCVGGDLGRSNRRRWMGRRWWWRWWVTAESFSRMPMWRMRISDLLWRMVGVPAIRLLKN